MTWAWPRARGTVAQFDPPIVRTRFVARYDAQPGVGATGWATGEGGC